MIIGKDIGGFFKKFFAKGAHQAFLLSDERGEAEDLLTRYLNCENKSFCKKCRSCEGGFGTDVIRFEEETLKIEDAREIQRAASQSSFGGNKIFLLKNKYMAQDAQATLLKTLEEPYPDNYFILSKISQNALSRPLLSRLVILRPHGKKSEVIAKVSSSAAASVKERGEAEEIFRKLEIWAQARISDERRENYPKLASFIEDLYWAKKRFFEKTYSQKMLLEHILISKDYIE